jgi:hypothetical protein
MISLPRWVGFGNATTSDSDIEPAACAKEIEEGLMRPFS